MSAGIGMRGREVILPSLDTILRNDGPGVRLARLRSGFIRRKLQFVRAQSRKESILSRYVFDGGVVLSDWIFKRHLDHGEGGLTRSITQTKQAGKSAAPWGIHSHS